MRPDRADVGKRAEAVQQAIGNALELNDVTRDTPAIGPAGQPRAVGIELYVVKPQRSEKGLCAPATALGGRAIFRLYAHCRWVVKYDER